MIRQKDMSVEFANVAIGFRLDNAQSQLLIAGIPLLLPFWAETLQLDHFPP
jgi:hypothetical protein